MGAIAPNSGHWEEPDVNTGKGRAYVTVKANESNVNGGNNSISRFNLVLCEFTEGSSSAIKTMEQARALALAVVMDLSLPIIQGGWETICVPFLSVTDIVKLRGFSKYMPGAAFTDDLVMGVPNCSFTINKDGSHSTLQFRGQGPAGRRERWFSRMAGVHGDPGVKDGSSLTTHVSPGRLSGLVGALFHKTTLLSESAVGSLRNKDFSQPAGPSKPPEGVVLGPASVWNTHVEITTTQQLSGKKALVIKGV
jgi:hypothetical protein